MSMWLLMCFLIISHARNSEEEHFAFSLMRECSSLNPPVLGMDGYLHGGGLTSSSSSSLPTSSLCACDLTS